MSEAPPLTPEQTDALVACVDIVGRMGAREFQIRYSDDEEPTVWFCVCVHRDGHAVAAGMDPISAAYKLAQEVVDGGVCAHCRRVSALTMDWREGGEGSHVDALTRLDTCWYVFDPETKRFRRSCEGDAKIGRNDPCPCGSGQKWKNCHGRRG